MTQNDWQARLTETVAGEVRRYRKMRKLSGRALAERCAELGSPIAQPVLSNLELGRRESISIAEIVVLAQALKVSPTLLICPVTTSETMEILPGREADTGEVLEWFAGETRFVPGRTPRLKAETSFWYEDDPTGYVHLYRAHDQLVNALTPLRDEQDPTFVLTVLRDEDEMRQAADELRDVRNAMRKDGLRLPALPAELAHVDPEDAAN